MRQALEIMQPVGAIKKGVDRVLNGIVRMIGTRGDPNDPLFPTLTLYFVRFVETLTNYVTLYEHLSSPKLLPITPSDIMARVWGLINRNKKWQAIARGENVEKLFREFHVAAPPSPEGQPQPPPAPQGELLQEDPPGAGPLPIRRRPMPPPGEGPRPPGGGPRPMPPPGPRPPRIEDDNQSWADEEDDDAGAGPRNPVRFYTGRVHRSQTAYRGRGRRRGANQGIAMTGGPGQPPQPPTHGQVLMGKRDEVAKTIRRLETSRYWRTANRTCRRRR